MTTVSFDFATDTSDGSYLGFYSKGSGFHNVQSYARFDYAAGHVIDMQIGRNEYSTDGSVSVIRNDQAIGIFTESTDYGVDSFPVLAVIVKRTNVSSIDRFRLILGTKFSKYS